MTSTLNCDEHGGLDPLNRWTRHHGEIPRRRHRFRAAVALVISAIVGTAAVASPPTIPGPAVDTAVEIDPSQTPAIDTSLRMMLTGFYQSGAQDAAFGDSSDRVSGDSSDRASGDAIDRIDMSDLEALEKRLRLDSLEDLEPDLEAMERRLDLRGELTDPKIESPSRDGDNVDGDDSDTNDQESSGKHRDGKGSRDQIDDDAAVNDQFERALPSIVDGHFVMPPLDISSLQTETIGNGRQPKSFRSLAETPRMPLPESPSQRNLYWQPLVRTWAASGNFSHPLFFEDRMLERHGHTRWGYLQPLASGARFFSSVAMLPYLASIEHPCDCRYTMGYFRTGSCTPRFFQRPPWDREAVVAQSIASAGGLWIMP